MSNRLPIVRRKRVKMVDEGRIVIGDADPVRFERIGVAMAKELHWRNVLFVASTDLSHYPSADIAATASLDPARLSKVVAAGLQKRFPGLSRAVTVRVIEPIPGDWQMLEQSLPHEKEDSRTAVFKVPVPADGETVLTYRVRTRFF